MSEEGAWPCGKCGQMIFSFNFFAHDCIPAAPVLDWDDGPREGRDSDQSIPPPGTNEDLE